MKVVTTFVNPPIPDRNHDWAAYLDGEEEHGPYGYASTEEGAINALIEELVALMDNPPTIVVGLNLSSDGLIGIAEMLANAVYKKGTVQ